MINMSELIIFLKDLKIYIIIDHDHFKKLLKSVAVQKQIDIIRDHSRFLTVLCVFSNT